MTDARRNIPLSAEQEKWYEAACARLNPERLKQLLIRLINIHSPTGAERAASEFISGYMREHVGERSRYQPISEETGNAIGEIRGAGGDICHALGRKWQSLSIDPALCPHPLSLMLTAVE